MSAIGAAAPGARPPNYCRTESRWAAYQSTVSLSPSSRIDALTLLGSTRTMRSEDSVMRRACEDARRVTAAAPVSTTSLEDFGEQRPCHGASAPSTSTGKTRGNGAPSMEETDHARLPLRANQRSRHPNYHLRTFTVAVAT